MRTITKIISALLFALPATSPAQDTNNPAYHSGMQLSAEYGAMSKMDAMQQFGRRYRRNPVPDPDPHKRKLTAMGVRETGNKTTFAEYEIYEGEIFTGNNVPMASVTDADGNTYMTGGSSNPDHPGGDFFTLKVNATGEIAWQKREPAAQFAVEYGSAIALDSNGDLVVTGLKWNGNDTDIRTIKYSPDGTKIWDVLYDGGFNGLDMPVAITADTHGNTYITGPSWGGAFVGGITLKYDSSGSLVWDARDEDGEWTEPFAITVDNNENVVVTGVNLTPPGYANYHTVKYNSDGEEQWAQSYNYPSTDPEHTTPVTNSVPSAVATDSEGNVYVTGVFDTALGRFGTIKYDTAGNQQWIKTYKTINARTEATSIAIKGETIYVCGTHRNGYGAGEDETPGDGNVLIAYNPAGAENWITLTYDLLDAVNAELLFDDDNNPVVAARGLKLAEWNGDNSPLAVWATKFSPEGEKISEASHIVIPFENFSTIPGMTGAGLDADGNVYFHLNSFYSAEGMVYEVVKSAMAATAPGTAWSTKFSNLGSPHASMLYAFPDNHGGTISTGRYYNFNTDRLDANWFVVKHDTSGAIAWEKVYNIASGDDSNGIIGRADQEGNVYIALLPHGEEGEVTVKKLSPQGEEQWETNIAITPGALMWVLEPGPEGTVYVGGAGFETKTSETPSVIAVKLGANGTILWQKYVQTGNEEDTLYGINAGKVSRHGEFVLTGTTGFGGMVSQTLDLTAVKLNNDGTTAWVTKVPVPEYNTEGEDLLISHDGSVYINGYSSFRGIMNENILVAKISPDGEMLWHDNYGEAHLKERSYTIKQYGTGEVAVVGFSLAGDDTIHNTILKYSADGELEWDYFSELMRYYNDFHLDGSGKIFVMNQESANVLPNMLFAGYFTRPTLVTVDEEGNGNEEFFIGPEYAQFFGEVLVPHEDGRLLLGGSLNNQSFYEGSYYFETAHDGSNLGTGDHKPVADGNLLGQNYPNPVKSTTEIPFFLADGGDVTIKLYNTMGRLVRVITDKSFGAGHTTITFNAEGLAEGIYYYQIVSGKFKQARKMVVSRK